MLYIRNINAFIAVKVFIILSNQGGAQYGPNFFASASSGWELCGSSSGCSLVPWTHRGRVETARAPLELFWPRGTSVSGLGLTRVPEESALPGSCHFSGDGVFLRVTVLVHSLKSFHTEQMFSKLTPSSAQLVLKDAPLRWGAGLSHAYTHLSAVSALAES